MIPFSLLIKFIGIMIKPDSYKTKFKRIKEEVKVEEKVEIPLEAKNKLSLS